MPTNNMSRLEVFIGSRNTTGEVLETASGPTGILSATDTYRWLPDKHCIAHDADARFDGSFNTRKNRLCGLWELKGKKSGWQPWIRLELVRA